jgi:ATP-dependent DNA helicase RecG
MRLMTLILEERKQFICTFKKYFCGTRFTRLPFLKRLKEKHKLGDACVSGKASRFDTVFFFYLFWSRDTSCPHIFSSKSVSLSKGKIFVMSPITVYFIFFRPTDSMKKDFAQGIFFNISDEDAVAQSCRLIYLKLLEHFLRT